MKFLLLTALFGLVFSKEILLAGKQELQAIQNAVDEVDNENSFRFLDGPDQICFEKEQLGCFSKHGPLAHIGYLPSSPSEIQTKFYVFTPGNPHSAIAIIDYLSHSSSNGLNHFKENSKVAFVIHGFNNKPDNKELNSLKDSLLTKVPVVVIVDWHKGAAGPLYLTASTNTQLVGRQIAVFTQKLITSRRIKAKDVHLLGFSLGAQVSGFAGRWSIEKFSWKFGRISALDSAAPLFEGHPGAYLTHEHADFVDAIHTSAGLNILSGEVGFRESFGHIDFYPNGGKKQPRCTKHFDLTCNHYSSVLYMDASISAQSKCQFSAFKCSSWNQYVSGHCNVKSDSKLGYESISSQGRGDHFLNTTKEYPFCNLN